jgi:hypothetical protein
MRQLKSLGVNSVVSYADPEQGHEGILYKACNFFFRGAQKQGTPYYELDGRIVYSRNKNAFRYEGKDLGELKRKVPKLIYEYYMNPKDKPK